jgi:hypothetical protein
MNAKPATSMRQDMEEWIKVVGHLADVPPGDLEAATRARFLFSAHISESLDECDAAAKTNIVETALAVTLPPQTRNNLALMPTDIRKSVLTQIYLETSMREKIRSIILQDMDRFDRGIAMLAYLTLLWSVSDGQSSRFLSDAMAALPKVEDMTEEKNEQKNDALNHAMKIAAGLVSGGMTTQDAEGVILSACVYFERCVTHMFAES